MGPREERSGCTHFTVRLYTLRAPLFMLSRLFHPNDEAHTLPKSLSLPPSLLPSLSVALSTALVKCPSPCPRLRFFHQKRKWKTRRPYREGREGVKEKGRGWKGKGVSEGRQGRRMFTSGLAPLSLLGGRVQIHMRANMWIYWREARWWWWWWWWRLRIVVTLLHCKVQKTQTRSKKCFKEFLPKTYKKKTALEMLFKNFWAAGS